MNWVVVVVAVANVIYKSRKIEKIRIKLEAIFLQIYIHMYIIGKNPKKTYLTTCSDNCCYSNDKGIKTNYGILYFLNDWVT